MDWTHRLRLRQLAMLMDLHSTCNLSQTGERLGITQPALSKWLKDLEKDLQIPLFKRHSRGLIPTPYCDLLVQRSRLILNDLDRTAEELRFMASGGFGHIKIGATPISTTDLLPKSIAAFHSMKPKTKVSVMEGALGLLLPQLREGLLDCIISRFGEAPLGQEFAQQVLFKERIAIVCASSNPLKKKKRIGWDDILDQSWVGPPAHSPLHRELEQELSATGKASPGFIIEVASAPLLVSIVRETSMLGLMTFRLASQFSASGQIALLDLPLARDREVGVIWIRDRIDSPFLGMFLDALRREAGLEGAETRG